MNEGAYPLELPCVGFASELPGKNWLGYVNSFRRGR